MAQLNGSLMTVALASTWILTLSSGPVGATVQPWDRANIDHLKRTLFREISNRQVLEDQAPIPHSQPLKQKGVYDCMVRFNFAGECWQKELRHRLGFFDNNPFVPIWVSILLLEAHIYGGGIKPQDQQLYLSLDYLQTTIDRSRDYDNSLIGFYPYVFDETKKKFVMRRVFVEEIIHMFQDLPPTLLDGFKYIIPDTLRQALALQRPGNNSMDGCLNDVSEDQIQHEISNSGFMVMQYHTISPVFPSDSDDTFSWLGLGAVLKMAGDQGSFTGPLKVWLDINPNITSAFEALKHYSYRPFSQDADSNTIDTRTYYALRPFLEQAREVGSDVALVTTWFQHIDEQLPAKMGEMTMPTFVNDVCLAVGANVLYGVMSTVLSGLVPSESLDDPKIEQLVHNTSTLIEHMVHHELHDRQDLVLFYYPPRNQFFFFLSRTLFLLEMHIKNSSSMKPIIKNVYSKLKRTLQGNVTNYLTTRGQMDKSSGTVYFDDFIGDGDIDENGDPLHRGEDRIFSTAMAANSLMYTWSIYDRKTKSLTWKPKAPTSVVATVEGCVRWLILHATDADFKPWNAFFSSGRKGLHNLPFWYPANRFQFINGTHLPQPESREKLPDDMFFAAMQGFVDRADYEKMLKENHFGWQTPTEFPGYNAPGWNSFAIWSSEAYSYAAALLAVSLFDRLS